MDLRNKAVLITGASRGLGAGLARSLGKRGARLVLVGRDRKALDAIVGELRDARIEAHGLAYDVGDKLAIHPLVGAATALVGTFDVVIHNASTLGPTPLKLLLDTDCEALEAALAVNLVGPFRLTKALAGPMSLRKNGLIVFLSSDASVNAYPKWGAYGASKAASDHLARTFAVELEAHGVTVLSVDPGEMNTKMHADAVPDADVTTLADPAVIAERIASLIERADSQLSGSRVEVAS